VFGFVKKTYPKRSEGRMQLAGKGSAALVPASARSGPEREWRFGLKTENLHLRASDVNHGSRRSVWKDEARTKTA